ncbi:MAG: PAS domain S-box protein [Oscillochloris sp.]|nr:PAS domain S-box protein [Oscillochloris sp.]
MSSHKSESHTITPPASAPGVAFVDPELRIAEADPAFVEIIGLHVVPIGAPIDTVLPPTSPPLAALVGESLIKKQPVLDLLLREEGGTRRWLVSLYPLLSRVGRALGVDLILSAISDDPVADPDGMETAHLALKHQRFHIGQSDGPFRAVFEQADVGIILTGPNGGLLAVNPGFCAIVGYDPEALRNMHPRDLTHPADRATELEQLERVLRGEQAPAIEKRYIHRNGNPIWTQVARTLVRNPDQSVQFGLILVQNINAAKQAEEALRVSEGLLRRLADNATIGLLISERDGSISYINPALRTLLGYEPDEFGAVWQDLTPPEYHVRDAQAIAELRRDGVCRPYEKVFLSKDGRRVPVLVGIAAIDHDPNGEAVFAVFITDLSSLHEAEAALAQTYQAEQAARRAAERSAERAERLLELTAALSRALTPEGIASVVISNSLEMLGAEVGVVLIVEHDQQQIRILDSSNLDPAVRTEWERISLALATPLTDAVRRNEPVWLENIAAREQLYPHLARAYPSDEERSWAALPLSLGQDSIGVIGLAFPTARRFDADERTFLTTVAGLCAQALERARLTASEREALNAADEALALLDTLINSAPIGLAFMDNDFRYRRINAAMAQINHRSASEHIGRLARDVFPQHAPIWEHYWQMVLETGEPIIDLELTNRDSQATQPVGESDQASGDRLTSSYALVSYYPVRRLDGEVLGVGVIVQDITERKLAEQERAQLLAGAQQAREAEQAARARAEEALRIRDAFLSVAAHELKNPLTSLLGQAQLLRRRLMNGQDLSEANQRSIDVIVSQSQRLNQMITDMLDSARIEAGQLTINRTPFDLNWLVRHVAEDVQVRLNRHQLRYVTGDQPLMIEGDAVRLEQVLQNLLSNAVKYSPAGGIVEVRAVGTDTQALLSVRDEGVGIAAEVLPMLFERFYRAPNEETRQVGGVGIGLYVVREIVVQHEGTISVQSSPGQGSTFTVHLPLWRDSY